MALRPELLKRRQRTRIPRALGEKAELKGADEELRELLKQILAETEKGTLFTTTLEMDRLLGALAYGGYLFDVAITVENQLAPGATVSTYLPVVQGFVYIPDSFEYWISLPWWLTVMLWRDSDLPAPPAVFFTRAPDRLSVDWTSIGRVQRFLHYVVTNNHAVNTANFSAFHLFGVVTLDTWRMIEIVYFEPLVNYVRDKAEELTGRPWP